MKICFSWVVLIATAFLPDSIYCQEIHLNELRRRDCTKTETNGSLDKSFSYFFNATVKLNKQLEGYTIVQFEILRENSKDYSFLFDVSIAYDCSGLKLEANHQCKKIGDGVFNIDVALRNESGDKIRGQIIHYNKTVLATDVKVMSGATEAADSTGVLKINGQKMPGDENCTKTIDVTDLIFEFECSNPDTSCVIEVKVDDTIVIKQNTDNAVFEEQVQSGREMLVNIKYAACSLNGKFNNLRCFIKIAFNKTAFEEDLMADNVIIISVAVAASTLTLIILLVLFLTIRHKRNKFKSNKNDIDNDECNTLKINDVSPESSEHTKAIQPLLGEKKDEQEQNETDEDEKSTGNRVEMDIFSASKNGKFDIVQELINTNPLCINDTDNEGYTPLMHASRGGQENIVKLLIEKEAKICIKDGKGMTALMISCETGHEGIEERIIERMVSIKGMDVLTGSPRDNVKEFINEPNNDGMTPLILASRGQHENCVQLLMSYNPDVNLKDKYEYTALMYACEYGYGSIASSLIRGNADVKIKNPRGKTCLMLASENGHHEIVELLLKDDTLIDEIDDEGSTALRLASKKGHVNIVQLLRGKGASDNGIDKEARST